MFRRGKKLKYPQNFNRLYIYTITNCFHVLSLNNRIFEIVNYDNTNWFFRTIFSNRRYYVFFLLSSGTLILSGVLVNLNLYTIIVYYIIKISINFCKKLIKKSDSKFANVGYVKIIKLEKLKNF